MMRIKVDLPQPDAPIRQINSPLLMTRLVSRRAWIVWPLSSNSFETCSISSKRKGGVVIFLPVELGAPAQEPVVEPGDCLIREKARDADDDHAADDEIGPRQG